jgi:hypothetical protein
MNKILIKLIQEYYPIEYELLGEARTEQIVNTKLAKQELEIKKSSEGLNFDVTTIIVSIAAVIGAIKNIVDIRKQFVSEVEKSKTIQKEIETIKENSEDLTKENIIKLIQELESRLNEEKKEE